MNLSAFLIFIPLLPFIGFLILGLGQQKVSRSGAGVIASSFAFLAFCLSVLMFIDQAREFNTLTTEAAHWMPGTPGDLPSTTPLEQNNGTWLNFRQKTDVKNLRESTIIGLHIDFGFTVDRLSSLMLLIVTGIGTLIHIYSIGYMSHDKSPSRFFAYLNLFLAMMLTLVMANNLVLMFVGWEGVGLCSYLLIGFWYEDPEKAKAGRKAFVVNRIGDVGFLLGICIFLFAGVGLNFNSDPHLPSGVHEVANLPVWVKNFYVPAVQIDPASLTTSGAGSVAERAANAAELGVKNLMVVGLICLFIGAIGKSAQIPLFVWLPDAMAGPTPVSALIHAATMVTAGVYMVIRLNPLFGAEWASGVRVVIATVGIATALVAGATAITQTDIKKVLAYSTVSQLGYMVLGLGVGAFDAAFFHLFTHAFFKALLFLCAGSVIHGMSGEQDMRQMGGLKSRMKVTYWTMVIGAAGLAGIPLLCGFFSKDEILYRALHAGLNGNKLYLVYYLVGVLTAAMTAFYSFRLIALTFHGSSRATPEAEKHIHESPTTMTAPLMVLALGTLVVGFLNLPANINHLFGHAEKGSEFYSKGLISRYLQSDKLIRDQLAIVPEAAVHPGHGSAVPHPTATENERHAMVAGHAAESAEGSEAGLEWGAMLGSGLLAIGMAMVGFKLYTGGMERAEKLAQKPAIKPFYLLSHGKFFFDEVFDNLVVAIKVVSFLAWLIVDYIIIDSLIVDGLGTLAQAAGENFRRIQTGVVNSYLLLMLIGAVGILGYFAYLVWWV